MRKILLLCSVLVCSLQLQGQSYGLTVFSEDYMDLMNSTSLNVDMTWDDPNFAIPIGFDFQLFDEVSDTLYIPDYAVGGSLSFNITDSGFVNAIIPFGPDIVDRAYDFMSGDPGLDAASSISYLTEGNPGSRIFKIEWNNVGFFGEMEDDNESTDFANFQVWLYEGTNVIDFHYGPVSVTQPDLCYDEEPGPVVALFSGLNIEEEELRGENYVLESSVMQPTLADVDVNADSQTLDGTIPASMVYRFTPALVRTKNFYQRKHGLVFPNPTAGILNLSNASLEGGVNELRVLNQVGQVVLLKANPVFPLDLSDLAEGIYSVVLKTEEGLFVERILKQ